MSTACGNAPSTVGPFYCPNDRKVYLDIAFMNELQQRLGAQGDFAQAYIVAHEIGHHVQNQLGVMEDVNLAQQENPDERQRPLGPARAAGRLPRRDLGALGRPAGGSARDGRPRGGAERGRRGRRRPDPEAVRRQVNPDTFTHGSGEQRVKWFKAGFQSGDPTACDTFKGDV